MADIRLRFKRVAEAFDGMARARLCESSGSEHSPENYSLDLSDIVESFFEREGREEGENGDDNGTELDSRENETKRGECDDQEENDGSESKELLRGLLFGGGDQGDDDQVKESVRAEVERVSRVAGDGPERPGFKRRVMTRLRARGFDAGLCKSKWERNGRVPSGSYEYIDLNVAGGTRYVIELSLPGEFTIARPTPNYASLLQNFPPIFVGKVEDLKQIVRLMSNEIKRSLKSVDMHVPPWRRHVYMQAKWFGSYRRTTNEVVEKTGLGSDAGSGKKRWVGFMPVPVPVPGVSYCCREGFGGKGGVKMGKLAMEFIGNGACVTVNSIVD